MRLLLINPNRSEWITERVAAPARAMLLPGDVLDTVTSTTGPTAVTSPQQLGAAAAEVLALAQSHGSGYDALLLGISLDCGLAELRGLRGAQPVIGMTEAACLAAGPRFGLLTVGPAMAPLYAQHVQQLGLAPCCVGVAAPDCPEAFASQQLGLHAAVRRVLLASIEDLRVRGADTIVLAGAVLCGYGAALTAITGLSVLEGSACAVVRARMLLSASMGASVAATP